MSEQSTPTKSKLVIILILNISFFKAICLRLENTIKTLFLTFDFIFFLSKSSEIKLLEKLKRIICLGWVWCSGWSRKYY